MIILYRHVTQAPKPRCVGQSSICGEDYVVGAGSKKRGAVLRELEPVGEVVIDANLGCGQEGFVETTLFLCSSHPLIFYFLLPLPKPR